jgi:hypothetical protein
LINSLIFLRITSICQKVWFFAFFNANCGYEIEGPPRRFCAIYNTHLIQVNQVMLVSTKRQLQCCMSFASGLYKMHAKCKELLIGIWSYIHTCCFSDFINGCTNPKIYMDTLLTLQCPHINMQAFHTWLVLFYHPTRSHKRISSMKLLLGFILVCGTMGLAWVSGS